MDMDIWLCLIGALAGVYVFLFGILRNLNQWRFVTRHGRRYNLPPGDMGWPLIGTLLPFLKAFRSGRPDSFIHHFTSKYGKTGMYKTHLFGSPSVIVTVPEVCRHVLMNDEQFVFGYSKATRILTGSKALNSVPKPEHRRLRRLIASLISGNEALSLYIEHVEGIVVTCLEEWGSMKEPVEFLSEMKTVAFKVLLHIFIGANSAAFIDKMEKLYNDFHMGFMSTAVDIPGTTFSRALKARNELIRIFEKVLEEKRENLKNKVGENRKKDMADLLLEVRDEDGEGLDDGCIIDLLIGFFFAGHETSAHTIMRAIMFLSENPETLLKAKAEQEQIVNARPADAQHKGLTMKEIKQMEYLSKVMDETLRKTSLAFTLSRETKVDVNLNGYTIPKGWKILVWTRAVHMNPEIYENPHKFDPSRWDNPKRRAGSFIPFGAGMRLCPGIDLSKLEIAIFLHYFIHGGFRLERVNPNCPENHLPLPTPTDNCLARVVRDS
ncbi:beta-amyrin 11-oxidase-like [Cucurbita moschata]|uniref:Beta-amyrin 11-oxidase-like n=1 Tax=Cucurbita moschata TaxID=3662 RepID=A0A6J1ET68_CUCMO|nr:beta-amyrin 11-oxidase-like [Cucurbita moschata]